MRDGTGTKEKIREAALKLFVERGVDAVAVRDITTAVGVRPGTLYVHWPSKDALVEDLFRSGFAAYGKRITPILDGRETFPKRLGKLIQEVCVIHDEDETLFAFLLLTQHQNLPAIPADNENPVTLICRAIEKAVIDGDVPSSDPLILTSAVIGTLVQAATFRLYGRTDRSMSEMADQLTTMIARALGFNKRDK